MAVWMGILDQPLATSDSGGSAQAEKAAGCTMDEAAFRRFYERTARPLRAYLMSSTGNPTLADDLLQESYFRLLRAEFEAKDETHRKNYLFRIATNLLRDEYRRRRPESTALPDVSDGGLYGGRFELKRDIGRLLRELKPRHRQLLWFAYVEGMSHREIATLLGVKPDSVRPMLHRARRQMAALLKERGLHHEL